MEKYLHLLPDDIAELIILHKCATIIQNNAIKMFYKKYGTDWESIIKNYQENLDYFCYITGIYDPLDDYINYYR